jgi:transcriptional regulator with XRE-family HTH domain
MVVRRSRRSRGLSQDDLARELNTSRMTISRLERGGAVSMTTMLAALRLLGQQLTARPYRYWMTVPELAERIRAELERGDQGFAIRLMRIALKDFANLTDEQQIADFLAKPDSTGDPRWDLLLATAVAWRARARGLDAPPWTRQPKLANEWFPMDPGPLMTERIRKRTPREFARKNILIDEREWSAA